MDVVPSASSTSPVLARSWGKMAGRFVLRILKLVSVAVAWVALLAFGMVWLVDGIDYHRSLLLLMGVAALGMVAGSFVYAMLQSRRQTRAAMAAADAKRAAGLLTCHKCGIDFEQGDARTTPKPWHHTAILVALSLAPLGLGAVVIWAMGVRSPDSLKALVLMLTGAMMMGASIRAAGNRYIRCPQCGRACGSVAPEGRGFQVKMPPGSSGPEGRE